MKRLVESIFTSLRSKIDQYRSKFIERSNVNNFDEQLSWWGKFKESKRRFRNVSNWIQRFTVKRFNRIDFGRFWSWWIEEQKLKIDVKTNKKEQTKSKSFTGGIEFGFVDQKRFSCSTSEEKKQQQCWNVRFFLKFNFYFVTTIVRDQWATVFLLVLVQY